MKSIKQLFIPSIDATDYRDKTKKPFFVNSFYATEYVQKACTPTCYYFVGEKGSGKTALALHIQNASPNGLTAKLLSISETQYIRFIKLRERDKLAYTDYSAIWRSTLLFLIAHTAIEKHKKWTHRITGKFRKVEQAIGKYERCAGVPELEYVVEFMTTLTRNSDLKVKVPETIQTGISDKSTKSIKTTQTEIRSVLLEAEKILRDGIRDLKLNTDIVSVVSQCLLV